MIALVVAIERYAVRNSLLVSSPKFGGIFWSFGSTRIKSKTLGRDILCFGDSMVLHGVVPAILHEPTGKRAYNLAIQSGSAPSSYFLLRRAVDAGARPSVILVDFVEDILTDNPASKTRPYPWAELLSLRETLELGWISRDADLLTDILIKRALRSVNIRFEIRQSILTALRGEVDQRRDFILATWRNLDQNQGACLYGKNPDFKDAPLLSHSGKGLPGTWNCDRVNAVYVRRFMELAAQVHARVYWLLTPVSPGWQSALDYLGDEARYISFIRRIQNEYPNVVVVDGRYAGFKSDVFLDSAHLDRDGAVALSASLGEIIQSTSDKTALASRWIDLPAYALPSRPAPSEVFSDSLAIARQGGPAGTATR